MTDVDVSRPTSSVSTAMQDGIYNTANSLGRGFDIFGAYNMDSLIPNRIFDWNKTGTYETGTFLGAKRVLPKIVSLTPQTETNSLDITATSRSEVQSKLATHAGVEASYGPFSGEFKLNFSQEAENSTQYFYALKKSFISLGYVNLDSNDTTYLSDSFNRRVAALPDAVNAGTLAQFADFFQDYGFYYVDRLSIGGELNLAISVATESNLSKRDMSSSMELMYKSIFSGSLKVDVSFQQTWKTFSEKSNVRVRALGGKADLADSLAHIDPKSPDSGTADRLSQWTSSLEYVPAVTNMHYSGIWKLCGSKRSAVEQAVRAFGVTIMPKLSLTSSPKGPSLMIAGKSIPVQVGADDHGFVVVVLDRRETLEGNGVKLNKVYARPALTNQTERLKVYADIMADIDRLKLNNPDNIVCLISHKLNPRPFPPHPFYQFLREAGGVADNGLKQWETMARRTYVHYGEVAYCLVGVMQGGEGNGLESYGQKLGPQDLGSWPQDADTSLSCYLIRSAPGEKYDVSR